MRCAEMIDFGQTSPWRSVGEIRHARPRPPSPAPVPNARAIAYRMSLGLSQRAMSRRLGLSPAQWQRIEAGLRPASPTILQAMGDA